MNFLTTLRRAAMLFAVAVLLCGIPATTAVSAAATAGGWVSFANWSPTASPVDAYIYPAGASTAQLVVPDISYHGYSGYTAVGAGGYTVKMRAAGSSSSSQPLLSASLTVQANDAYQVAALPTASGGKQLKVISYNLTAPSGEFAMRVVNASASTLETFHCSCGPGAKGDVATDLSPGSVSASADIPTGDWTMTASGPNAEATLARQEYVGDTILTMVYYQGPSGVGIQEVEDAVGGTPPAGTGISTGFGGTAPHGPGSPLPWLAVIGAGALLAVTGGLRLRRSKSRRPATGV